MLLFLYAVRADKVQVQTSGVPSGGQISLGILAGLPLQLLHMVALYTFEVTVQLVAVSCCNMRDASSLVIQAVFVILQFNIAQLLKVY